MPLIYNFLSQGLNDILELLTKLSQEYDRHELIPGLALLVAAKCFRTVAESEVKVIYSIVTQVCCSCVGEVFLIISTSPNFNFFQVEEVEKFTSRILLVCQNESDEYTDRCRIYVAQAIQTTAEHLIFSSHPSVMVSNS